MSRPSSFVIDLVDEDCQRLVALARKGTAEQRMAVRARIVLAAATGEENAAIAGELGGIEHGDQVAQAVTVPSAPTSVASSRLRVEIHGEDR